MTLKSVCTTLTILVALSSCSCHLDTKGQTMYQTDYKNTERLVTDTGAPESSHLASPPMSAMLSCASSYSIAITDNLIVFDDTVLSGSTVLIARATNEMISTLCGSDYYYGVSFITCVQLDLPQSPVYLDKLLLAAFNMTRLPNILYGGCNATSELNKSMECIINGVTSNLDSLKCLTDVGTIFTNILNTTDTMASALEEVCRVWGTMVTCITPYIGMCNSQLAAMWMLYGRQILTPQCYQHAFPVEVLQEHVREDPVHEVFEAFHLNMSAISVCASQYSQSIKQFLPTAIINPAALPDETINGLTTLCGNQMEEFMFCIDEKRLNSSSAIDNFMFKIISTPNMRMVYSKMCSQLEVLKSNVNCFLNAEMELQTCMCYMTDLIPKVVELTAQPAEFTFDKVVDPFCSFYVSFAKCYIGLLSMCSRDLGLLMQDVYLGALTPTCLGTTAASACSLPTQNTSLESSMLFQCGEKVARFVSQETREANVTMDIDVMMMSMEELIIEAYNYTCGIGEEILGCLSDKVTVSQHPFDQLLLKMFNSSKFASILKEGCQPALLNDVRPRLEFILSMVLSDPRSSSCIEALNFFDTGTGLNGLMDLDQENSSYPFCRIWADFSECIESKLSCSSPNLAKKWRKFTINSLNIDCHIEALHQQEINPIGPECDRNSLADSALSLCGMSFMASSLARKNEAPDRPLHNVVMDDIQYFCKNDMDESRMMIDCLKSTVPSSSVTIDKVVGKIFNLDILDEIPKTICSMFSATRNHMGCIVQSMEAWQDTQSCVEHLTEGFDVAEFHHKHMTDLIHGGCRGWKDFSNCVLPHINACDIDLSMVWSNLSHILLTKDCQSYIAQTARHNLPGIGVRHVESDLLTLLTLLIITVYYLCI